VADLAVSGGIDSTQVFSGQRVMNYGGGLGVNQTGHVESSMSGYRRGWQREEEVVEAGVGRALVGILDCGVRISDCEDAG